MPTSTESAWQEITTAALLGTQRKPFQPPTLPGDIGAILDSSVLRDAENSTTLLLRVAAITALHRRAGRIPARGTPPVMLESPLDTRPRCSVEAGRCLERILISGRSPLLDEWISLANRTGVRLREEYLASLLDRQKMIQPFRQSLLPILGERGCWLAGQNPDWDTFVVYQDARAWQEGDRRQRLAYLSDLRATDAQAALRLIESTWEQESTVDRALFLQTIETGLSMADEPFLETVLDDRRKEVHQVAARLLARLPASRLMRRMTSLAQRLLNWKQGLLRGGMEARLPAACSEEMLRDGIEPRPPASLPFGEKAWWLAQVIALTPPSTWSTHWNKKAAVIIEAVRKHEMEEALVYGWTEAALRFGDNEWLDALALYENRRGDSTRMYELFSRLPESMKETAMLTTLRENPSLAYDQTSSTWLSTCRFLWGSALTQAVTSVICWTLQQGDMQPWRWEILLREIGMYFHPAKLQQSIERISEAQKKRATPDPYARDLLVVLQFRLDMHRIFLQDLF